MCVLGGIDGALEYALVSSCRIQIAENATGYGYNMSNVCNVGDTFFVISANHQSHVIKNR